MEVRIALALAFVAGCAAPPPPAAKVDPPPPPRNYYNDAQQAYAAGNVIDTVQLLRKVPESAPESAKAKTQIAQLTGKADKLILKLQVRADEAVSDGYMQRAVTLLTELQARAAPDKKTDIDKRLQNARDKLAGVKAEYDDKLKRGRDRLHGGDAREAYRLLARAADLADDNGLPWGFAEQQSLEQARIESPPPVQRQAAQREVDPRRRRRRQVSDSEMIVGTVDTFASQEQEIKRLKNVRDLVDKARDFKNKGMIYEAIVTLGEAHAKDPDSGAVKLGLDALEDDRSRLVDGYLEVADRYLAKQELEAAVPYYKRVLRLEPDNTHAKEAVQMYQNLEKIKQERTQNQ